MENYRIIKNDELYHHGILGQKWGKRNGPPYPLDASDHSASEKKAGWKKSLDGGSSGSSKHRFSAKAQEEADSKQGLTDDQKAKLKTAAKIGAAAAVTGLAVYGAYKYGQLTERATYDKYMALADKQIANAWKEHQVLVSDLVSKQVKYAAEGNSFKAHELYEEAQREMDRAQTMIGFSENLAYATARNRIVNEGNKQRRRNANNVIKNRVMK